MHWEWEWKSVQLSGRRLAISVKMTNRATLWPSNPLVGICPTVTSPHREHVISIALSREAEDWNDPKCLSAAAMVNNHETFTQRNPLWLHQEWGKERETIFLLGIREISWRRWHLSLLWWFDRTVANQNGEVDSWLVGQPKLRFGWDYQDKWYVACVSWMIK